MRFMRIILLCLCWVTLGEATGQVIGKDVVEQRKRAVTFVDNSSFLDSKEKLKSIQLYSPKLGETVTFIFNKNEINIIAPESITGLNREAGPSRYNCEQEVLGHIDFNGGELSPDSGYLIAECMLRGIELEIPDQKENSIKEARLNK